MRSLPCKSPIPANPRHGTNWNGNWFIFILRHTLHRVERVWNWLYMLIFEWVRLDEFIADLPARVSSQISTAAADEPQKREWSDYEWRRRCWKLIRIEGKFSYFKSYLQLNTPVNYHHETIKNVPTLECSLLYSVEEKWEWILSVSQGYFGVFLKCWWLRPLQTLNNLWREFIKRVQDWTCKCRWWTGKFF